VFDGANYLFCLVFSLACVYPFYYILIYSVSDTKIASTELLTLWPRGFTLLNYAKVLLNPGVANSALVSAGRTVLGTALMVGCTSFFAYLLTRRELIARKLVYRLVVTTMYLNAGLIPYFILIHRIGLMNRFLVYIIPGAVAAFNLILVKTYIEQLPASVQESAMIDGAGVFRLYTRIIAPLCMPILATITVFGAVGHWNSFSDNLFFVRNPRLQTMQMMLFQVIADVAEVNQNVRTQDMAANLRVLRPTPTTIRMTTTMIATLPVLFVYPFLQRFFVKGIMIGAIKG
jgi:putative aldouronate transport system permease protein